VVALVEQLQNDLMLMVSEEKEETSETTGTAAAASFAHHLEELLRPFQAEDSSTSRWEPLAVGLFVATEVLQRMVQSATQPVVYMEGPRVPEGSNTADTTPLARFNETQALSLCEMLHAILLLHMEHVEPRVRTYVAKTVGAYGRVTVQWESQQEDRARAFYEMRAQIHKKLVQSIHSHIVEGRPEQHDAGETKQTEEELEEEEQQRSPEEHLQYSRDSSGALDDTTGWRALETNWQCLAALVAAMGAAYIYEFGLDAQLLEHCQHSAIVHKNRHVRAAAMAVMEQWIVAIVASKQTDPNLAKTLLLEPNSPFRNALIAVLKTGLADNWSQVRMAASVLCRVLCTTLQENDCSLDDLFPSLLPRMCLNRFYLAQGVKLYSHQSWKIVVQGSGIALVAKYLPAVVRYYVQMADADNHVVREAACQAIAELATKLGSTSTEYHDLLVGHLEVMMQALLMCFYDESWPVRDEACLACGLLCKAYPDECRSELKTLWERWTEQLTDQIWSVREDAAVALGDALEAYGEEFLDKLREFIKKIMPAARDQPAMTQEAYKAHQNNVEMHTDSQLYSCGSLAPKLRKGGAGRIGCSNCGIDRPKAPWEATDGCIYLIRELVIRCCSEERIGTPIELKDDELVPMLRELADVCRVQHFPQSSELRATLWRQLPAMAHAIGKDRFKKKYLEIFMELMFSNLESKSASQLSIHAAGQCAEDLAHFVGPSIFRGRLEDYQKELYDKVMRERQMMPKGPAVLPDGTVAPFSPYGPPGLLDAVHKPTAWPAP
jgi:hypothetical protein